MLDTSQILVAVEHDESAIPLLEKTLKLARAAEANVHVVRIMHDEMVDLDVHTADEREALKTYLMQSEETWLEDLLDGVSAAGTRVESATIWQKDEHVGIIHAARECGADLIMKAPHRPHGLTVHAPQDWALLRHSDVPVLMVKAQAWHANPLVIAAVDALNDEQRTLSERVLTEAGRLAMMMDGHMEIVVAYPFVNVWTGLDSVPVDFEKTRHDIETMIRNTVTDITESGGIDYRRLHIVEGNPAAAIRDHVAANHAEMLVVGTVAREGLKGAILGNTAETILYRTECDVAVLK